MPTRAARRALAIAAIGFALAMAPSARAQSRAGPDSADFALAWARGSFVSPVVCRFGERAERGLRKILIEPGPRTAERRVDRVRFVDLGARGSDRCTDELGVEEPNVVGTLLVTHQPRRPNSDTPERDFKQDLARGPIAFAIERGVLRFGSASLDPAALPEHDFAGGKLRLAPVEPGSDDARRIADLPGARALHLEVEAKDGTRFAFPIVELGPR